MALTTNQAELQNIIQGCQSVIVAASGQCQVNLGAIASFNASDTKALLASVISDMNALAAQLTTASNTLTDAGTVG